MSNRVYLLCFVCAQYNKYFLRMGPVEIYRFSRFTHSPSAREVLFDCVRYVFSFHSSVSFSSLSCLSDLDTFRRSSCLKSLEGHFRRRREAPQKQVKAETDGAKEKTQTRETFLLFGNLCATFPLETKPGDITDESLAGAASTADSTTWRFRESDVIKATGAESCA